MFVFAISHNEQLHKNVNRHENGATKILLFLASTAELTEHCFHTIRKTLAEKSIHSMYVVLPNMCNLGHFFPACMVDNLGYSFLIITLVCANQC